MSMLGKYFLLGIAILLIAASNVGAQTEAYLDIQGSFGCYFRARSGVAGDKIYIVSSVFKGPINQKVSVESQWSSYIRSRTTASTNRSSGCTFSERGGEVQNYLNNWLADGRRAKAQTVESGFEPIID